MAAAQPPSARDLIATLAALVLPSAITWLYFFRAASAAPGVQATVFGGVKVLQFVFPVAWVFVVQRQGFAWPASATRGIGVGLAFGVLVATAAFGIYFGVLRSSSVMTAAAGEIRDKVAGVGLTSVWKYAALGAFYTLFHSFLEEYYWRWFVFGQLRRSTSFPIAAAISSLGFMAHHVLVLGKYFGFASPTAWLLSASIAIGGFAWAWLYEGTGSLVGPWLSHLLVDAAIFAIGYDIVRDQLHT